MGNKHAHQSQRTEEPAVVGVIQDRLIYPNTKIQIFACKTGVRNIYDLNTNEIVPIECSGLYGTSSCFIPPNRMIFENTYSKRVLVDISSNPATVIGTFSDDMKRDYVQVYLGNNILVTGGSESQLKVWNLITMQCVAKHDAYRDPQGTYRNSTSCDTIVHVKDDLVVYCNNLGRLEFFDIHKGKLFEMFGTRSPLAVIDDGTIAGVMLATQISIISITKKQVIKKLPAVSMYIESLATMRNNKLASTSNGGTVIIWDLVSCTCTHSFAMSHASSTNDVFYLRGDLLLHSGDKYLRVVDANNGMCLKALPAPEYGAERIIVMCNTTIVPGLDRIKAFADALFLF